LFHLLLDRGAMNGLLEKLFAPAHRRTSNQASVIRTQRLLPAHQPYLRLIAAVPVQLIFHATGGLSMGLKRNAS
jgi:hypothetical protein